MSSSSAIGKEGAAFQAGFTLLEMLVVISLLVAVASIATGAFSNIVIESQDRLVRTEMLEIADAIRQFRADTGFYPKTGPFNLDGKGGAVVTDDLPGNSGVDRKRWFYSPANFYQLLGNPLPDGHRLAEWDPEAGRGWRGPYLKGFAEGYVDIGDGVNDTNLNADPKVYGTPAGKIEGDPLDGTTIEEVQGLSDPYSHRASGSLLAWSADEGGVTRKSWGRPYLLFKLDGNPVLISMGKDGYFDSGGNDDVMLYINGTD